MAKKSVIKRVTEFLEGDREPGEEAPKDDSHIKMGEPEPIVGEMSDPEPEPEPSGDEGEEEYEVEIAGTRRKVDKKTYDLVMEERATREYLEPAPTPESEPEPEGEDFDPVEFFGDPETALKKIKDEAVAEATTRVSRKYAVDKAQEDFWSAFYRENPALADDEMLVKMVLAQNMKQLRNLSDGKEGRDKLAELVEAQILRYANKQRGHKSPDASANLEGGPAPSEPTMESSDAEASNVSPIRPPSVGDEIKARRLKRQRAQRGETQLS